jgi:hypothetical protein
MQDVLVVRARNVVVACVVCVLLAACSSSSGTEGAKKATTRTERTARCTHPSPGTSGPGHEIRGTTASGTLWGLALGPGRSPLRAGDALKIVWRMTGNGPLRAAFTAPDGTRKALAFGPDAHGASSYARPGDEWGTGFRFTTSGCWHIRLTRSDNVGDVWLDVRSARA